ncbi:MAG: hypothetical protein JNK90_17135 [Planctomycetaceae bacterium]|nr:hypothetical protein [Planctomycetaceae bacterium]
MSVCKIALLFISFLVISETGLCHAQTVNVAVSVEDEKLLGRLQALLASEQLGKRINSDLALNQQYLAPLAPPHSWQSMANDVKNDHDAFKRRLSCLCWARFQLGQDVLAYANMADAFGDLKFYNTDSVWQCSPDSPVEYLWLGANSLSLRFDLDHSTGGKDLDDIRRLHAPSGSPEPQIWKLLKKEKLDENSNSNSNSNETQSRKIRQRVGFNPELLLSTDREKAAVLIKSFIDYHTKVERNITSPTDFRGFLRLLSITRAAVELGAAQHLKKESLTALTRLIVSDFSKYEFFGGHVYLEHSWTPESSQHLIPLICTRILQHLRSIYVPQIVCYPDEAGQKTLFIDLGVKAQGLSDPLLELCEVEAEEPSRVLPVFLPRTDTAVKMVQPHTSRFKKVEFDMPVHGHFQFQLPSGGLCSYPKKILQTSSPK